MKSVVMYFKYQKVIVSISNIGLINIQIHFIVQINKIYFSYSFSPLKDVQESLLSSAFIVDIVIFYFLFYTFVFPV